MRKINKLCLAMLMVCSVFFLTESPVKAESLQIQVVDDADILNDSEESSLTELVEELELSSKWDVMVVSTADAGGLTSERYAEEWFDQYTTKDDGVICLIDMDNREIMMRTFGEAIYYLTDSRVDEILDNAWNEVSNGAYSESFESMIKGIGDALQRGIPDGQYTYDEDTKQVVGAYGEKKRITLWEGMLAVVAALAAGGITIGTVVGKYRLKWGGYQYSCRENSNIELTEKRDTFVNQIVTHRKIPKESSGGGSGRSGGSRSTTHVGAGGRRSGGGGRKF